MCRPNDKAVKINRCSHIHAALNDSINELLEQHGPKGGSLLDIGCWDGATTMSYAASLKTAQLSGVECMPVPAESAKAKGITIIDANLETDILACADESIDIAVCNQVFEHLKDIFHPMDEIARVLKTGGLLVISVPNLASFHNRCMLALGLQPSSIRIWGPHVRGYSLNEFTKFCTTGGCFEVVDIRGVGFYPFSPKGGGNLLGNVWKTACHTPIWVLRRTAERGTSFRNMYQSMGQQTLM